jgi:probable rRNA maturation factor
VIVFDDRYGYDFDIAQLQTISDKLTKKEIELIFVSDDVISDINHEFRGKKLPTDVLSFPLQNMPNSPLGTIVISIDKAKNKAGELGHNVDDEISLLFIHGLLHLLGYDHEDDDGQMREKEREIIKEFDLPDSLIVRSE